MTSVLVFFFLLLLWQKCQQNDKMTFYHSIIRSFTHARVNTFLSLFHLVQLQRRTRRSDHACQSALANLNNWEMYIRVVLRVESIFNIHVQSMIELIYIIFLKQRNHYHFNLRLSIICIICRIWWDGLDRIFVMINYDDTS